MNFFFQISTFSLLIFYISTLSEGPTGLEGPIETELLLDEKKHYGTPSEFV